MYSDTKIIFLDIDGVLNSTGLYVSRKELGILTKRIIIDNKYNQFKDDIDIVSLGLLKYIVRKTGAKIVISSAWRVGKTKEIFIEGFEWLGWKDFPIIDMTIVTTKFNDMRGDEVNEWLERHPDIKNYIIYTFSKKY